MKPQIRLLPGVLGALIATGANAASSELRITYLQPVDFPIVPSNAKETAGSTESKTSIDGLSSRYDSERLADYGPSRRTVQRCLLHARTACPNWTEPALNLGDRGQLELQWWRGAKSLTLFFDGSLIDFLKSWGQNTETEMDDGEIDSVEEFAELWEWLQG